MGDEVDPVGLDRRVPIAERRSPAVGVEGDHALPYDQIVLGRTWTKDNAIYVSPAQAAIDCLTGPGRMPAEGDALLDWMRRKAPRWQATSLTGEPALP